MSLFKSVSFANNALDTNGFVTTDAINYVTDKHGSVVDVNSVKRSADRISEKEAGRYVVTYRYGKASGKVTVTVRTKGRTMISAVHKSAPRDWDPRLGGIRVVSLTGPLSWRLWTLHDT